MQYLTFAGVKIIMGGLLGKPLMRTFGQLGLTTFSNLANFIVSKRCAGTQTWRWWQGWGRNGGRKRVGWWLRRSGDQWWPLGCGTLVECPVPSELYRPQAQAIGMLATGPLGMYGHVLATGPPPPRSPLYPLLLLPPRSRRVLLSARHV